MYDRLILPLPPPRLQGVASAASPSAVLPSTIVRRVGGSWGDPNPPLITAAAAVNSGHNLGFGDGDSVVIRFNQAVALVALVPGPKLSTFLQLHPFALQSHVSSVTWQSNDTLVVSFANVSTLLLAAGDSVRVGRILVNVTGVLSANGKSPKGNCSAVVDTGSWGDAPNAALQDQSSVALRLVVQPPTVRVAYPVNRFLVQVLQAGASSSADGNGTATTPYESAPPPLSNLSWNGLLATATRSSNSTLTVTTAHGIATSVPTVVYVGAGYVAVLAVQDGFDVPDGGTATFDVSGLSARHQYCMSVAVNNPYFGDDDAVGPSTATMPACLMPSPPSVAAVGGPLPALLCVGGQPMVFHGSRLGVFGSAVALTVTNQRNMSFTSTACAVTTGTNNLGIASRHRTPRQPHAHTEWSRRLCDGKSVFMILFSVTQKSQP